MTDPGGTARYGIYWRAWLVLLGLTVLMVLAPGGPAVIGAAIFLKATIIGMWFMHLRYERPALSVILTAVTLATALILFGLIAVDAVKQ